MNGKSYLLGLVLALGIGAGVFIWMSKEGPASISSRPVSSSPAAVETQPKVVAAELLPDLNKQTIAFAVLSPRRFDVIVPALEALRAHFASTALWKKFDLDKQLTEAIELFEKSFREGYQKSGESSAEELDHARAFIQEMWADVSEGLFAISSRTFDVGNGIKLPETLLSLAFKDQASADKFYQLIDTSVMEGKPELKKDELTIKRLAGKKGLDIEVVSKELPQPLKFVLVDEGSKVFAMIGGNNPADFLAATPADRLSQSDLYKKVGSSQLASSGMYFYSSIADVTSYLDSLLATVKTDDPEISEGLKQMRKTLFLYADFNAIGVSLNLSEGLGFKSCVATRAGSPTDTVYEEMFRQRAAAGAPANQFYKLVDEHTIAAVRISFDIMRSGLKVMEQKYADPAKLPGYDQGAAEMVQQVLSVFKRADEVLDKFAFKEGGVVANISAGTPFPAIAVFFGGSKLSKDDLIQNLADEIKSFAASPQGADLIKVGPGKDGQQQIGIDLGPTVHIVIERVNDNSVLASLDPGMLQGAAGAIRAAKGYLDTLDMGKGDLKKMVVEGDYFLYLNTDATIEMAKPYLPLLLSQSHDPQIQMGEVEEVLDKLRTSFISTQISSHPDSNATCSEGRLQLVK